MITTEIENPTQGEKVCFEIEDILNRKNFAFQIEKDQIVIIDTSREHHNPVIEGKIGYNEYCNLFGIIPTTEYSVKEHFNKMYEKSISDNRMCFIAWIEKIKI